MYCDGDWGDASIPKAIGLTHIPPSILLHNTPTGVEPILPIYKELINKEYYYGNLMYNVNFFKCNTDKYLCHDTYNPIVKEEEIRKFTCALCGRYDLFKKEHYRHLKTYHPRVYTEALKRDKEAAKRRKRERKKRDKQELDEDGSNDEHEEEM